MTSDEDIRRDVEAELGGRPRGPEPDRHQGVKPGGPGVAEAVRPHPNLDRWEERMLLPTTVTWVILANSERCRALEERRRGGVLNALDAWDCQQTEQDRRQGRAEPAVFGQRFAFGQSVLNPHDAEALAERRFLARYAHQLNLARTKGRYEGLILIATPPALGVLREALGRPAQRSVERTATCDCVDEAADTLRARVRALRTPR